MNKLLAALVLIGTIVSCTDNNNEKKTTRTAEVKLLASPASDSCAGPFLFSDNNGVVYLSWVEKRGKESSLKFSTLSNGQWSEPVVIASGNNWFVNWADYPVIAADGNNNLVAHFLEKSAASIYAYDVKFVTSSDKGRSWSNSKILHDDGKQAEHGFVSMLPYGDKFFVSWLDGRNTNMEESAGGHEEHDGQMSLRGAIVDKQGNKINEWELDNRVCDCCQTSATITANGPIVVYRDRSEDEIRDISIVRLVNGYWTKPKTIFSDNWKIAGCPVNGPRSDAQGNILAIAWFSSPDKKGQVNIIFTNDGGAAFNSPIRIDEGKGIGRVDVVMLDEKSAMVSWMEGATIKAARVYKDGTKEPSITIASSSTARSSGFPQMTKAGNKLIFAWSDGKGKAIKVASLVVGD
ncbi:MAG: exo-alpha-sialidase [Ferruginibacter sp.]|nr:exo-alpha-sialidase [Chitinophagaceae bacterium]